MSKAFKTWTISAATTKGRLARIIRNQSRFDDATVNNLLNRIDAAIERDNHLFRLAERVS